VNNAYAWYVRGAHHAAMCRTSVESVLKADHNAHCMVITDERNPSWDVPGATLQYIDDGLPIMLANLEAQVSALASAWVDHFDRLTLLDTDTILLKPIQPLGDIAFTWRDSIGLDDDGEKVEGIASRMPYNYGVIVAQPNLKSFEALIWIRERIRVMHDTHQKWYGNQLAVVELAGPRPDSGSSVDRRQIPWRLTKLGKEISIGKLPCETHNFTPQTPDDDLTGKYLAHFKGKKRDLMRVYANRLGLGWYVQEPPKPALQDFSMVASL
jgi:hypothetical protein